MCDPAIAHARKRYYINVDDHFLSEMIVMHALEYNIIYAVVFMLTRAICSIWYQEHK